MEGNPIPEGAIVFGRHALADVIFVDCWTWDSERHAQHDGKRGDDRRQVDNTCCQRDPGGQWDLIDAIVEKQSTQDDEPCHEMRKTEGEEIVEDRLGWPNDWSKEGVEPCHGGDDR